MGCTLITSLFMVGLAVASATCHAQPLCPWLNVATASGFLGSPATATVNLTPDSHGVCSFQTEPSPQAITLIITVAAAPDPQTGQSALAPYESRCTSPASAMKAIGNEAVICGDDSATSRGELVIGRVRDKIFTIAVTADAATGGAGTSELLQQKVKAIAEQVAGILF